jgi:hypothetical protein
MTPKRVEEIRTGWAYDQNGECSPALTMTDDEVRLIISQGYCRTSNKYGMLSRIDRPDWKAVMEMNFRRTLIFGNGQWESHYRRVYSKDTIELGGNNGSKFPSSDWNSVGYVPLERDPAPVLFRKEERQQQRIAELEHTIVKLVDDMHTLVKRPARRHAELAQQYGEKAMAVVIAPQTASYYDASEEVSDDGLVGEE